MIQGTLPVTNAPANVFVGEYGDYSIHAVARSPVNNVVWAIVSNAGGTANLIGRVYRSEDNGATWTSVQDFTQSYSTAVAMPADIIMKIDIDGYLHVAYRGGPDEQTWYYKRGTLQGAAGSYSWSFSSAYVIFSKPATFYAREAMVNMVVHRTSSGWAAHFGVPGHWLESYEYTSAYKYYPAYNRANISSTGSISMVYGSNAYAVGPEYAWGGLGGDLMGQVGIDFKHTGDGLTVDGATPEVYLVYQYLMQGDTTYRFAQRKLTNTSGTTWSIGSEQIIESGTQWLGVYKAFWNGSGMSALVSTGSYNIGSAYITDITTSGVASPRIQTSIEYLNGVSRASNGTLVYGGTGSYGSSLAINRYKISDKRGWVVASPAAVPGRTTQSSTTSSTTPNGWFDVLYSDYDSVAGPDSGQTIRSLSIQLHPDDPTTAPEKLIWPVSTKRFDVRLPQQIEWQNSAEAIANQYDVVIDGEAIPFSNVKDYVANHFTDETTKSFSLKYSRNGIVGPGANFSVFMSSWNYTPSIMDASSTPSIPADEMNILTYFSADNPVTRGYQVAEFWSDNIYSPGGGFYSQVPVIQLPDSIKDAASERYAYAPKLIAPTGGKTREGAGVMVHLDAGTQYTFYFRVYSAAGNGTNIRPVVYDADALTHLIDGSTLAKGAWVSSSITFTPPTTKAYYIGFAATEIVAAETYYIDNLLLTTTVPEVVENGQYEYKVHVGDRVGWSPWSETPGIFTIGSSTNVYVFDGSLWVPKTRKVFDGTLWKDHLVQKL